MKTSFCYNVFRVLGKNKAVLLRKRATERRPSFFFFAPPKLPHHESAAAAAAASRCRCRKKSAKFLSLPPTVFFPSLQSGELFFFATGRQPIRTKPHQVAKGGRRRRENGRRRCLSHFWSPGSLTRLLHLGPQGPATDSPIISFGKGRLQMINDAFGFNCLEARYSNR